MSADLYLILAALLDCSREEAKRRVIKAAYSVEDGPLAEVLPFLKEYRKLVSDADTLTKLDAIIACLHPALALGTTSVEPGLNRHNASKCGRCGRLWDVAGLVNGECPHLHNCLYNTLLPIKRELAESRHESAGLKMALELVEGHRYAFDARTNARASHDQARTEYVRLLRNKLQEYGG